MEYIIPLAIVLTVFNVLVFASWHVKLSRAYREGEEMLSILERNTICIGNMEEA